MDKKNIEKIDTEGMLSLIKSTPTMLLAKPQIINPNKLEDIKKKNLKSLVFIGMGGSAISGDIIKTAYGGKMKIPILVNRNYTIPGWAKEDSLVIAMSYSGNTEETLSAVKQAEEQRANIVVITSGGTLKKEADRQEIPIFLTEGGLPPRAAMGYLLGAGLLACAQVGLIENLEEDLKEAGSLLKELAEEYDTENNKNNIAFKIAEKIIGTTPVIFASTGTTSAVGRRFNNQLSENSKISSLSCLFPELNHNEIENLAYIKVNGKAKDYSLVIFEDEDNHERIKKRIEVTRQILKDSFKEIISIKTKGKSRIAKILSQIILGDFISFYLAIMQEIDPTPVSFIEDLKEKLKR